MNPDDNRKRTPPNIQNQPQMSIPSQPYQRQTQPPQFHYPQQQIQSQPPMQMRMPTGGMNLYQQQAMYQQQQQRQLLGQQRLMPQQTGFGNIPLNLPAPPPMIPRVAQPPPPPMQQRAQQPQEANLVFSADQSFQLLTQLMALGYIEKREELPNMIIMILQHFENLRRIKRERQSRSFRQNFRNSMSSVSEPQQIPPSQPQYGPPQFNTGGKQ